MSLAAFPPPPAAPLSLADEIAVLAADLDAATHRLLTCIRRFDESEEWAVAGAQSCAHWLTWRIGLDETTAREKVRVARALGRLPVIDAALSRGEISYAKVRALTRVATIDNETRLIEISRAATGAQLERICRRFRRATREIEDVPNLDPEERTLRVRPTESGMLRLEITLHPDEAALVLQAIEKARDGLRVAARVAAGSVTAATPDASAEAPPPAPPVTFEATIPARATAAPGRPAPSPADGLVFMAEHLLAGPLASNEHGAPMAPRSASGGGRYQVFVHMDRTLFDSQGAMDTFLDDGTRLSAEAFRRVSCDTALVAATDGSGGDVLTIGRRSRVVPPAIRRALWLRDRGCRFPTCANRRFVHGHHVRHWAHGGETSLDNLVLLCTFHHGLVHEGGFGVRLTAGGELWFVDPKGRTLDVVAPAAIAADPSVASVILPFRDPGVNLCDWDGEPVDYDTVVDSLISYDAG
jgi:hypothetical protein